MDTPKSINRFGVPMPKKTSGKLRNRIIEIAAPLSLDEIALFKQLPVLTLEQVARVLQKPTKQVYEISRTRAKRPLPVFKAGKSLCSTWQKIQQWIDEGFAEKAA
jgi:hypothetical protein